MSFVDTHCHLQLISEKLGLNSTIEEIVRSAEAADVKKLLTVSGSLDDLTRVIEIIEEFPFVFGALGVHPHDASKMKTEDYEFIQKNMKHRKISAIGEIGLDYYYEYSPRDIQNQVFIKFLSLALEFKKPVIIHTRDAEEDTIRILNEYGKHLKGVVHCFTGSLELAEFIIKNCPHLCLGFTGVITFKNAQKIREVVKATPIERIFIETDSPFMAPDPMRGKTNQPAYIPYIARKVAEIKELSLETVLQVSNSNSAYLFQEHQ